MHWLKHDFRISMVFLHCRAACTARSGAENLLTSSSSSLLIILQVDVVTKEGLFRAAVPSGASTGVHEVTVCLTSS
jgi:hypothetical protein